MACFLLTLRGRIASASLWSNADRRYGTMATSADEQGEVIFLEIKTSCKCQFR
jgi:hypothetical protein